ncbi:SpoIIE family protein phosphatase [Anaerolineales bacterium HSG6]|nr:SpoIIE family protein phosphatase [Anaerolineales bacterium HSG6]MDM8529781.1 SpoIIE family protein phosphatase [Anaerolineales bacterium HSG25]
MVGNIRSTLENALGKLTPEVIDVLTKQVVVRTHEAGSVVCHEGEIEAIFYVIQEGQVAFTKKMIGGDDQLLGIKAQGEFFGELAVLDHAPRAATVHAISECVLIEIEEETLETVLDLSPSVARTIMRGIIRSVRDTDRITIAELQLKNNELARTLENLKTAQDELLRRERLERDLEIAAQVHKSILPTSFPEVSGFAFGAVSRPAREVGGDLYDVMEISDDHIGIVMADASGKSVQAAIYMAVVRALFLSETDLTTSPTEVAHRIHKLLLRATTSEMFVTAFYATINIETRYMRYIRGGHDRPVFFKTADRTTELLNIPGRFLGMLPNLILEEASLTFDVGDILVSYSDGVTDATRPGGEMYGIERLENVILENHNLPAKELAQIITQDIDNFREGEEQPDDLTMLVVKAVE